MTMNPVLVKAEALDRSQSRKRPADSAGSPSNKRVRLDRDAPTAQALTPPRADATKFAPGALAQVDLVNFQVSQRATFQFAPGLNMIIGPNGSGKSTVITAIFLIFQGACGDTSRSKFSDFVRNGASSGSAAVWFRVSDSGYKNSQFSCVKLFIDKNDDYSYQINGRDAKPAQIKYLAERHNIQVNNTCQFLPQERVSAFSAQTMHERLKSTLESVGEAAMIEVLSQLIEIGNHVQEWSTRAGANDLRIEQLQGEVADLEEKVQRLKAIEDDQKDLESLKSIEQMVVFHEAYAAVKRIQDQLKELNKEKNEFLRKNQPLIDLNEASKVKAKEQRQKAEELSKELAGLNQKLGRLIRQVGAEVEASSMAQVDAQQQDYELWQESVRRAKGRVDELKSEIARTRAKFDPEAMLEAQEAFQSLKTERQSLEREVETEKGRLLKTEAEISQNEVNMSRASDVFEGLLRQRLALLNNNRVDLQAGLAIIRENRDKFKRPVLEPAILSMSFKQGAEKQIGAIVNMGNLQTFICQTHDDWKLVVSLFKGKCKCRAMEVGQSLGSSLSRDKIQELGFDGVISDLLVDSSEMLACMNNLFGYNQVPYCRGEIPSATVQRIRQDPQLRIGKMVDSKSLYLFSRSKYGQKQTSMRSSQHYGGVGRFVLHCQSDMRRAKQRAIDARKNIESGMSELKERVEECKSTIKDLEAKRTEKEDEWNTAKKAHHRFQVLKTVLEDQGRQLTEAERRVATAESDEATKKQNREKAVRSMCEAFNVVGTREISSLFVKIRKLMYERDMARISIACAESDHYRLEHELSENKKQIEQQITDLREELVTAKAKLDGLRPGIAAIKAKLGPDEYIRAEERSRNMQPEEVRAQIVRISLELSLSEVGQSYEDAKQQLNQVEQRLKALVEAKEAATRKFAEQQALINDKAPEFEAKSRELVAGISTKFAEFFGRLGCRGEVRLNCPALKFDEWGVDIMVSYREGQPLRPLSGRTQSGGEKAVATAVYLMALQGYSKSPFFVVDEINQGMDKVNERLIHRFIVETTAAPSSVQYFLVTPKLLPDLCYNQTMKVLINNSSPHVSAGGQLTEDELVARLAKL